MKYNILTTLIIALTLVADVSGQSRKELEAKRLEIIKSIDKTSKVLEKTQKEKNQNLVRLKALEDQVNQRKQLIANLQAQVAINERRLSENNSRLDSLQSKVLLLKNQYSNLVRMNYLRKMSNSKWSYLLSSANLNNLVLRWKYMHQYEDFAKRKLESIQSISGNIKANNEEIKILNEETLVLMGEAQKNIQLLKKEQSEKDALIKKLNQKEQSLKKDLAKQQKEREKLNAAIEKIIIEELAKAKENNKKDSNSSKTSETNNVGFANNKGGLAWPVSNASITSRFGTHPHPTLKQVSVSNNGIDFSTSGNADVKVVFDGEVVGSAWISGYKNMVIVRHGNYSTVYANLEEIKVKKGQSIKKGHILGKIIPEEGGKATLHFELWKDKTKQNPESWLVKK